ncbi:MAG: hypothetical protein PHH84_07085, partial [Oscillospiraceae bacterium]|nr:hypothetical protein [Oscillospiraceae bacterium]
MKRLSALVFCIIILGVFIAGCGPKKKDNIDDNNNIDGTTKCSSITNGNSTNPTSINGEPTQSQGENKNENDKTQKGETTKTYQLEDIDADDLFGGGD